MNKEVINDPVFLIQELSDWLATKTLGGATKKSTFQYYDKHLWLPLRKQLDFIMNKNQRSLSDLEMLSCCYTGELFRVHRYFERAKSHIYPLGCYQSWCTEAGLDALSSLGGQVLLLRGHANPEDYAIRTIDLLLHLQPEIRKPLFSGTHALSRYCREHEVVMPITKDNIDGIFIMEAAHLSNWRNCGKPLSPEKWFRNNW